MSRLFETLNSDTHDYSDPWDYEKMMDSETAAKFLCLSRATLYGLVHKRAIPFRKHGRKLVFSDVDLQFWSEERKTGVQVAANQSKDSIKSRLRVIRRSGRSLTSENKGNRLSLPKKGKNDGNCKT